jgi:hypothetical protein
MESKELYSFTIFEDKEVFVEETTLDQGTGEEITIKKKTIEKSPIQIILKKPSRRQIEEADLEYSVEMSRCIKKGILTKAMLAKKYSDTGGLMSETESSKLVDLYKDIYDLQNENIKLEAITNKTEEIQNKISTVVAKSTEVRKNIVEIESSYRALFDHTADSKAQNRIILWYIINLTYIKKETDESPKPYFKGKDFEDKLQSFYEREEESSDQYLQLSRKLSTLIAFWFFNQASSVEDFKELDRKIETGEL